VQLGFCTTKDTDLYYYIPRNLPYEDIQMICRMPKAYPMYATRHAMKKKTCGTKSANQGLSSKFTAYTSKNILESSTEFAWRGNSLHNNLRSSKNGDPVIGNQKKHLNGVAGVRLRG
jgi:hypothetical protein